VVALEGRQAHRMLRILKMGKQANNPNSSAMGDVSKM